MAFYSLLEKNFKKYSLWSYSLVSNVSKSIRCSLFNWGIWGSKICHFQDKSMPMISKQYKTSWLDTRYPKAWRYKGYRGYNRNIFDCSKSHYIRIIYYNFPATDIFHRNQYIPYRDHAICPPLFKNCSCKLKNHALSPLPFFSPENCPKGNLTWN